MAWLNSGNLLNFSLFIHNLPKMKPLQQGRFDYWIFYLLFLHSYLGTLSSEQHLTATVQNRIVPIPNPTKSGTVPHIMHGLWSFWEDSTSTSLIKFNMISNSLVSFCTWQGILTTLLQFLSSSFMNSLSTSSSSFMVPSHGSTSFLQCGMETLWNFQSTHSSGWDMDNNATMSHVVWIRCLSLTKLSTDTQHLTLYGVSFVLSPHGWQMLASIVPAI